MYYGIVATCCNVCVIQCSKSNIVQKPSMHEAVLLASSDLHVHDSIFHSLASDSYPVTASFSLSCMHENIVKFWHIFCGAVWSRTLVGVIWAGCITTQLQFILLGGGGRALHAA